MRKILAVIFAGGLLLVGCGGHNSNLEIGESEAEVAFEKYVAGVSLVPIGTTDQGLLADASKVVLAEDSTYIIMDRMQRSLFKVTAQGEIVAKFQQIGRGPDDYTEMFDFDVDLNRHRLFLLCNRMPSKIIIMDLDFRVDETVRLKDTAIYERIAFFDGEWYLYSHNTRAVYRWNKNSGPMEFAHSERSGKGVFFAHQPVFYKNKDVLLINPAGDDVIYSVKDGRLERFYTLNWRDKEARYRTLSQLNPEETLHYAENAPPIIKNLILRDDKLIIIYSKLFFRMAVADIGTGQIMTDGILTHTLNNSPPVLNIDQDLSQLLFVADSLANQSLYKIDYRETNSDDALLVRYRLKLF